jgi:uncharacterized protein
MIVLLDTNALLLPHQRRIDIFSEIDRTIIESHEVATLSTVVDELKALATPSTKDGVAANVGLRLLEMKKVRIIPSEGPVDDAIVAYAKRDGVIVCTNDKELKRRLRKNRVTLLVMRGMNHLERV